MDNKNKAIGVFDSGLGGVSVLKELIKSMPNEKFIYFGDSANAPYGIKTKEECEKTMVDLNTEGSCEKLDEEHNLDVVNGGIMYNDRVYNKIS